MRSPQADRGPTESDVHAQRERKLSTYQTSPAFDVEIAGLEQVFIGGRWVDPATDGKRDVVMPSTEEVIARVADPSPEDADRAVAAARRAFDEGPWPRLSMEERADACARLADELEARFDRFARAWTFESGPASALAAGGNGFSAMLWRAAIARARTIELEERRATPMGDTLIVREPIGTVLGILAYNGPVFGLGMKIIPGLLAGCTIIVKHAPESALTSRIVAEAVEAAGLPEGVVSVLAAGTETTQHLVGHPGIDLVHVTAGTEVAKDVVHRTADRLARTALELGGKSPAILLEDVDLDTAMASLLIGACTNGGQVCVTLSRILAPRSRYEEVVAAFADAYRAITVGDPFDPNTQQVPQATKRAFERCQYYVARAQEEGATVVAGGARPEGLDRGFYFAPTVLRDVKNSMRVAQEEIFGPITCIIAYDDVEDAIAIANDTKYGLAAAVYGDEQQALAIARRIRSGSVSINDAGPCLVEPFGGVKQSGWGREGGAEGILEFTDIKQIRLGGTATH
jgi:acyl-CoA reductase-like NAD-dependent aldehyde dehydrogenase